MSVRLAELRDVPVLALLTKELGYTGFDEAAYADTVRSILAREDHRMWVAALESRIVGYALAHVHLRPGLAAPMVTIDELIVRADARNRGIGTALLAAVDAFATEQKAHRLELVTSRDLESYRTGFYARRGFCEINSAVLRAPVGSPRLPETSSTMQ